jgi:hypothetical protein
LWVWDWGRDESPTESQFRYYEAQRPPCRPHEEFIRDYRKPNVREALNALWDVVHKDPKLSFPEVVAAQAEANPVEAGGSEEEPPRSGRHRRHRRR